MDTMNHAGRNPLRVGACLSLSGRFSRFGRQAARALEAWAALDGGAQVVIEDDASDVGRLRAALPEVAAASDLLLGPYSTLLMRAAGELAAEAGWTVWNHGGSGDDVETAHPGYVISVLTPTRRYAEPFLARLADSAPAPAELRIAHGTGRFGRQVADGAQAYARQLGIARLTTGPADTLLSEDPPGDWTLLTAGTFEDDIQTVARARSLANPPRVICAVAAGVGNSASPSPARPAPSVSPSGSRTPGSGPSSVPPRNSSSPPTAHGPHSRTTRQCKRPPQPRSRPTAPGSQELPARSPCGRRPRRWMQAPCSAHSRSTRPPAPR
jgi:hypothetical protein